MTKELTPLEALKNIEKMLPKPLYECSPLQVEYDIIETALKENKTLKERIILNKASFNMAKQQYEEKLKALEIIKDKRVDVDLLLKSADSEMYNVVFENWNRPERFMLTQEEYNLLKEVL